MIDHFPRFPLAAFLAPEQPLESQLPEPAMLPTLAAADVIFGRDVTTGNRFLVHGRDVLRSIASVGIARPIKGVVIEIDLGQPHELQQLGVLMLIVKGHNDYQAGEIIEPSDD